MIFRVNGIEIEFKGDVPFTFNSPLFNKEISHSLQLTAPYTDTNAKAFGYIHRTDLANNKTKDLPAEFEHKFIYLQGTATVKFQNNAFVFYFKAAGDFYSRTKNQSVKDIEYASVTFASNAAAAAHIDNCLQSDSSHYTFPKLINRKMFDKFPVKFNSDAFINKYTEAPVIAAANPSIPFPFLYYVYRNILTQLGYSITSDVFESKPFLKKIIMANNYMLNEFEINATVLNSKSHFFKSIAAGKDPEAVTVIAHGLTNYQFVRIDGAMALENKIYQAEVKDEFTIKLIGADTSEFESFERQVFISVTVTKLGTTHIDVEITEEVEQWAGSWFYMYSDDYNGLVFLGWDDATHLGGIVANDPDYSSHTYANAVFVQKKYGTSSEEGMLIYLPSNLDNYIKEINLSKHLPNIVIDQFFEAIQEYLGIIPFVSDTSNNVDIKLIDEILADPNFIDITTFSKKIANIENPGLNGYTLQSKMDGADDNLKTLLPVTTIDPTKYTIKPAVNSFIDLPQTDKTNDVRLVTNENTYYVFSKGFLNAANSWKFICYNHLDLISGAGDYKIDANASTLLIDNVARQFHAFNNNCMSNTFVDVEAAIGLRLLIWHGLLDRGEANPIPYASHDIYDETGAAIPGANFALKWEGENGILNRLRKREINWQIDRRKDFSTLTYWPARLIADFKFWKKYRIDGVDCLVKSIKCTFKQDETVDFNETELARV